jgi:hypothetical protein
MARAKSIDGKGQGWHFQKKRHSDARKTGMAGGNYALVNNSGQEGFTFNKRIEYRREKPDRIETLYLNKESDNSEIDVSKQFRKKGLFHTYQIEKSKSFPNGKEKQAEKYLLQLKKEK